MQNIDLINKVLNSLDQNTLILTATENHTKAVQGFRSNSTSIPVQTCIKHIKEKILTRRKYENIDIEVLKNYSLDKDKEKATLIVQMLLRLAHNHETDMAKSILAEAGYLVAESIEANEDLSPVSMGGSKTTTINKDDKEITKLKERIEKLVKETIDLNASIRQLKEQIKEFKTNEKTNKNIIKEKDKEIKQLTKKVTDKDKEFEKKINEKEIEISKLNGELSVGQSTVGNYDRIINTLKDTIEGFDKCFSDTKIFIIGDIAPDTDLFREIDIYKAIDFDKLLEGLERIKFLQLWVANDNISPIVLDLVKARVIEKNPKIKITIVEKF